MTAPRVVHLTIATYDETPYAGVVVFEHLRDAECYAALLNKVNVLRPRLVEVTSMNVLDTMAACELIVETETREAEFKEEFKEL